MVRSKSLVRRRKLATGRPNVLLSWKQVLAHPTTCSWPLLNRWVKQDNISPFTSQNAKKNMGVTSNTIRWFQTLILWLIVTPAVKWWLHLGNTRHQEDTEKSKLGQSLSPNFKKVPNRVKRLSLRVLTVVSQSDRLRSKRRNLSSTTSSEDARSAFKLPSILQPQTVRKVVQIPCTTGMKIETSIFEQSILCFLFFKTMTTTNNSHYMDLVGESQALVKFLIASPWMETSMHQRFKASKE